ncbi:MAG: DUF2314 domain-containing protein [Pseudomonadota bacterium]
MGIATRFLVGIGLIAAGTVGSIFVGAEPDEVILVKVGDEKIAAARAQARSTLPEFWERLDKPTMFEANFGLKYDLNHDHPERGEAELIWTTNVQKKKDGRIIAQLSNNPHTAGFRIGQMVEIPEAAIVDWQIEREGKLDGHYSTRVLMAQMDPEEAESIKAILW